MLSRKLLGSMAGNEEKIYSDSVFSTYLYTGNGSTQTINNGIDLAGNGGLVWIKSRSFSTNHSIHDTTRGVTKLLDTSSTLGQATDTNELTSFNTNGFTVNVGAYEYTNITGKTYVSWTFRNADKFYNHVAVTKSAGSNATINFANLGTLGMVRVKRTDAAGSWYIWHRSLSAGQLLVGETTAAAATLGHVTVSGTTVTLVNSVIADGTYLVEAFAHDSSAEGIIQCGTLTTDGSGNASVNLGWEPQFALLKASNTLNQWHIADIMRGMAQAGPTAMLFPNLANAESNSTGVIYTPFSTGLQVSGAGASITYIYLAIRRPNKPPTTGTQVYNAIARTGTGAAATVTGVGFVPDLVIPQRRAGNNWYWQDRMRGANRTLDSSATVAESSVAGYVDGFDVMDGFRLGTNTNTNGSGSSFINWCLRRAPGFMDVLCYTGTGGAITVAHSLGVVPELLIVKNRGGVENWGVWHKNVPLNSNLKLNLADGHASSGYVATSVTSVTFNPQTFASGASTYVAYLFATLPGISKVGNYTGNGGTQTIACGFTTGARFVLTKRTDSTGDWHVWDTVRGIVAANDPHLSLNTTAAEVTTDDSIDPDASGFIVNQNAATNINVNLASYIFLAIA